MRDIAKMAVIGSGVMGGGIAAQAANAGVPVLLFDVTRDVAAAAVARLLTAEPAPFMLPANARLLTPCGIRDDMALLEGCGWIVEAVVEKLDVKQDLYKQIERFRAPGSIVSSNTSTIPLAALTAGAPEAFKTNFLVTHFFNPPRYMRLLEIVAGPNTDRQAVDTVCHFADHALGKSIVHCKDRPGFIANRLGCYWMQAAITEAFAQGMSVEEADAVMGKPFGIPKTGIFGLADLVGIDLLPQVNASLAAALEKDDLFHAVNVPLPFLDKMIADGLTGRKGKGGFYRINRAQGKRKETIGLVSGEYRPWRGVSLDETTPLLRQDSAHGRYARAVMLKTLAYASLLVGDAADDTASIDAAMRLGYNWTWGPFELIDRIGIANFRTMAERQGLPLAPVLKSGDGPLYRGRSALSLDGNYKPLTRSPGIVLLEDVKRNGPALLSNGSASLWDLGDGVACFELTTKMNTFDAEAFALLSRSIDFIPKNHKALVIYSDAANFSGGVNLNWLLAEANGPDEFEALAKLGQDRFKKLKYAPFPAVAAAAGLALGGGCELLLHCSGIQAHAESYIGLVEASVGILPAWGGCGEMILRMRNNPWAPKGPMPALLRAFELLTMSTVSKSAAHARELGFLRSGDGITMNRGRLLADAKAKALALAKNYKAPEKPSFALPGPSAATALGLAAESFVRLGKASAHDLAVAKAIATVLSGGDTDSTLPLTEEAMLALERREVLKLAASPLTQARIRHVLDTGKPLRN